MTICPECGTTIAQFIGQRYPIGPWGEEDPTAVYEKYECKNGHEFYLTRRIVAPLDTLAAERAGKAGVE